MHYTLPEFIFLRVVILQIFIVILLYILGLCVDYFDSLMSIHKRNADKGLLKFLKTLDERKLLCIPLKMSYLLSALGSGKHTFYHPSFYKSGDGMKHAEIDWIRYPLPIADFSHFKREYGVDTLVIDIPYTNNAELKDLARYDLDSLSMIYEDPYYRVYDLRTN